jgi:HupE / UreJ protein
MMLKIAALIALALLSNTASAHRIDEYLQATIVSLQQDGVQASMRLIPGVLIAPSVIAEIDSNGDGMLSDDEQRTYAQRVLGDLSISSDGKIVAPRLVSWSFPSLSEMRDGLGEIHIEYSAALPSAGSNRTLILANHHRTRTSVYLMNAVVPQDPSLRILAQKRNERQSLYELDYQQTASVAPKSDNVSGGVRDAIDATQFRNLFELGMHHIAEGTDHLLFLLALLLPAPLLALGSHWGPPAALRRSMLRILGIVTAFTLGHSITLSVATMGLVRVPERPVEVLIAMSIFVSAMHALRPLFPGREAWIAGAFGLIHGLAFASVLARLGLEHWERVAAIFAFNLGIETMQLLVVAVILPSLILMSRTPAYSIFRIGGAMFAAIASLGWLAERLWKLETPVDAVVNTLARHGLAIALTAFVASLACQLLPGRSRSTRAATA